MNASRRQEICSSPSGRAKKAFLTLVTGFSHRIALPNLAIRHRSCAPQLTTSELVTSHPDPQGISPGQDERHPEVSLAFSRQLHFLSSNNITYEVSL